MLFRITGALELFIIHEDGKSPGPSNDECLLYAEGGRGA
jgi:hypothetical protein